MSGGFPRIGLDLLNEGRSAVLSSRDIMALSGYSGGAFDDMEGEILFPPGCRFVVKRIEDTRHLVADPNEAQLRAQIQTAQLAGNVALAQQLQHQLDTNRVRNQSLDAIWVYLDEV